MGEDDDSDESDRECSGCVATESNSCGGCRELRIENEELRKRLDKVHKRLNIACISISVLTSFNTIRFLKAL